MTALLRKYGPYAALLLAGWGLLKLHDAKVRSDALAEQAYKALETVAAQRDSAASERDALRAERAKVDAARADSLKRLRATVAVEHQQNASLSDQLALHLASDSTVGDSLRALITRTVAGFQQQVAHLEGVIALQAALLHSDSLTIAGLDSTAMDLRATRDAALKQLNARLHPSLWAKVRDAAPILAVAGTLGLVVGLLAH